MSDVGVLRVFLSAEPEAVLRSVRMPQDAQSY